jgi:hypothetical protein
MGENLLLVDTAMEGRTTSNSAKSNSLLGG